MYDQHPTAILRGHPEHRPQQGTAATHYIKREIRRFSFFRQAVTCAAMTVLSAGLFWLAAPPAFSEPTLTFDPPPGTRLSNFDAYLTVTFELDGESWESLPWDWQNPRVRLNGTDISLPVRSLISGATASVLTPDEIVVSQQTMTGDRMVLALSGLRLDDGFNRLIVELTPTQEGIEPLKFDVSYPVIAGQDQATQ
ncbi:MAG: hypothetical protein AB4050_06405 [Synechococcus sp.]